jgi:hypothetical protein
MDNAGKIMKISLLVFEDWELWKTLVGYFNMFIKPNIS